jgi:integration host factor subunit beta
MIFSETLINLAWSSAIGRPPALFQVRCGVRPQGASDAPAITFHRAVWSEPSEEAPASTGAKLKWMTKQHLIDRISAQTRQQSAEVEAVIESFMEMIGEALHLGERMDLRGFGSFVVKQRKARQGRNPRTGETIYIPAKRSVIFKPGKELSEHINHSRQEPANI